MYIEVPEYDGSFKFIWDENFVIECSEDHSTIVLKANEAGLTSLARIFLELAQHNVPHGSHIHLDEFNALENGSMELIISKL